MRLIVGLGNWPKKYQQTRHNAGFLFVDFLLKRLGGRWRPQPKLSARIYKQDDLLLVQPLTFMNESGAAAAAIMNFYHLGLADLVVVHDDLDLPLGSVKLQSGKGPKGHNGLLSIYRQLGSEDFWHLRLGIDNRSPEQQRMPGRDYVLTDFAPDESIKLQSAFSLGQKLLENYHLW